MDDERKALLKLIKAISFNSRDVASKYIGEIMELNQSLSVKFSEELGQIDPLIAKIETKFQGYENIPDDILNILKEFQKYRQNIMQFITVGHDRYRMEQTITLNSQDIIKKLDENGDINQFLEGITKDMDQYNKSIENCGETYAAICRESFGYDPETGESVHK